MGEGVARLARLQSRLKEGYGVSWGLWTILTPYTLSTKHDEQGERVYGVLCLQTKHNAAFDLYRGTCNGDGGI